MLEGSLAIVLNLFSVIIIAFLLANIAVSFVMATFSARLLKLPLTSRKKTLWLLVASPWLSSFCIAILYFSGYLPSHIFESPLEQEHWHHMSKFNWLSWHGISLLSASLYCFYTVLKKLLIIRQHKQDLHQLTYLATPINKTTFELECTKASAFTAGFVNKKCFVSRGLLDALTSEEAAVVLGHEVAHANNNDPLKKCIFSLLSDFFLPNINLMLKQNMYLAMEQAADKAVVDKGVPAVFVAETLIKVARLKTSFNVTDNQLVLNFATNMLEQRIHFLLGKLEFEAKEQPINLMLVIFISGFSLSLIDSLVHFIEAIFSH